jgi:hypothetical protein
VKLESREGSKAREAYRSIPNYTLGRVALDEDWCGKCGEFGMAAFLGEVRNSGLQERSLETSGEFGPVFLVGS